MQVSVFSGNSMRAALADLAPRFERASGHTLACRFDPAKIILRRVHEGESADLALLGEEAIDELSARGTIDAASRRPLVRNGIGLAVRAGAARPDIASVESFKQALLAARSIAYTSEGASGMYFSSLLERLGIGAQVRAKARTQPGGLVAERIIAGDAELAVQQIPELMAVPGIDLVGPLPAELQKVGVTVAGIFAGARHAEAAAALVAFLTTPAAADVFRDKGFEPVF